MIDPTRITKLIRVAYVLTYLTFYTMWCTQGLGTNLAAYTLWRKCAYGLIVFMCAIVNAPLLIIFGGKIIKTMERRFDEAKPRSRGTLMGTESKSVPTKSIAQGERSFANPDSSIKSYANADAHGDHLQKEIRQFKALRLAMQVFIVVVYAGNVIYGLGCILGFELKMTPQGMVILKAVLDFLWFFISGHFNANLFYVEYNRVKRKPTSLSQK
ncbi:hypothetical protein EDD86DRAFT_269454 [Gorgonomyces haynaldii]|nr:hypothetical protein EDD86DRAFT_269454 [Gorgonomyces haynaldii]